MSPKASKEKARVLDLRLISLVLILVFLSTASRGAPTNESKVGSDGASFAPQPLTEIGKAQLYAILDASELTDLRWPAFGKYRIDVMKFYDAFNGSLPWTLEFRPSSQAIAIIRLFEEADTEGLNPEDYDGPRWERRISALQQSGPAPESELVRFDVALTVSVMRYISDLHVGRVNPRRFHFELNIDHTNFDLSEFLQQQVVNASDVGSVIATVEPPFPTYQRTLNALRTYVDLARRDDGELLPIPRKAIKPGDAYPGLPRLMRLLALLGDLPEEQKDVSSSTLYQGVVVAAVMRFQQRHGLEANGVIDGQTLKDLNTPLSRRVAQLQLTLERLRWLPHRFQRPPIIVNIPEFRLRAVDDKYRWTLFMKVVVGKAYRHQTPVFASEIKSVIFRPYWNVPLSVVRAEMLPHIAKDPGYLTQNSYEIVNTAGTVVGSDTVSVDMKRQLRSGKLGIRQTPGPDNALGLLKFDFPNEHDVYMHGTPAMELFSRSRRDFSHGCIRVKDPVALAAWLLQDQPEWTADHIRAATLGDKTLRVDLKQPVPVLIVYGTAVTMEDGEVHFFRDIYDQDAALEQALLNYGDSE